jgi:hypothetical protein
LTITVPPIICFVGLSELHAHLSAHYSHTGRPSFDPVLLILMLIVGYCRAKSEFSTELARSGRSPRMPPMPPDAASSDVDPLHMTA